MRSRPNRRLTIVSRHHDLDEPNDVGRLELRVVEKGIELVPGRDLDVLLLNDGILGVLGSRGEEVEKDGVVVWLDVVVDSGDTVDLSLDLVPVIVEDEEVRGEASAEGDEGEGVRSAIGKKDEERRRGTDRRIMVPIS